LGSPAASTPISARYCEKSLAIVAFDKPILTPAWFFARASAALLYAP